MFPIASSTPVCTVNALPPITVASPCSTGALDPNFKRPKSLQWNVDIQQSVTSRMTIDIAYVGNHGYDETYSQDINAAPPGTAYTPAVINACLASAAGCVSSSTKALMVWPPFHRRGHTARNFRGSSILVAARRGSFPTATDCK